MSIPERCDPEEQLGRYPPKLRGKNEYGNLREVPCTACEGHVGAHQIFPVVVTEQLYTPTIKHHCPRVALASSLRACSNKVWYDEKVLTKFRIWFRTKYIPEFLAYVQEEPEVVINMESWLDKFSLNYRDKIRRAMDRDRRHFAGEVDMQYEAFTKVELQFTTVPHDLKDTELNDTKERQICGPTDEKKALANAFINKMEEIASKHMDSYCGRANWIEICSSIDKIEEDIPEPVWGASDGSGFDMTQYPAMNELMNELLLAAAHLDNLRFDDPLNVASLKEVLEGSIILSVGIDHGDLKYEAVGRASGDGWTTFGNTMLMIAYWRYTFDEVAHVPRGCYRLKVKGDDVLFCLSKELLPQLKQAIPKVFTDRKNTHEHGLGQICKKVLYGDIEEMDFLSNEFFRNKAGKIRMTRIPARVIQTLSWTTRLPKNHRDKEIIRRELCYSKGECLKAWAGDLPIFGALANKMISLGKPGKWKDVNQYADGDRVWHKGKDDSKQYLLYLHDRYGITEREVAFVEHKIQTVNSLDGFLNLPCLEKFYNPAR